MQRVRWFALLLCLLACSDLLARSPDIELQGQWAAAGAGAPPDPGDPAWRTFDGSAFLAIPDHPGGTWIALRLGRTWPDLDAVLEIETTPYARFTAFDAAGAALAPVSMLDTEAGRWHGHGRIARPLPRSQLANGASILLRLEPGEHRPWTRFRALPFDAYLRDDARRLTGWTACFAVLLTTALMALCFGALLRDRTFHLYAGYVITYVLVQAVQTGYVADPLGWSLVADHARLVGTSAAVASVAFAAAFADAFAHFPRLVPRLRPVLVALVAALACAALAAAFDGTIGTLARATISVLLGVTGIALLAGAAIASGQSRYARYFLAGWTPLLTATALSSLQSIGLLHDWVDFNAIGIAAAAFESIVFSIGLADRALALRRDRERVGMLAERDPLTGLLNRRAWTERTQSARLAAGGEAALSLLFVDLDHFKQLNDSLGHDAGDQALVRMARILGHTLRESDIVGRYGGEEFVVTLPDCPLDIACERAEDVRHALERDAIRFGDARTLTASIGAAGWFPGETLGEALARADAAMYAAKSGGRNAVVAADEWARGAPQRVIPAPRQEPAR